MPPQQTEEQPSPPPTITPAPSLPLPLLPRQNRNPYDPYDLSSIYDLISSLYNPALYSANYDSIYSSLLSQYATLYPSYSWPTDLDQFLATATNPGAAPTTGKTRGGGAPAATRTGTALNNLNNNNNNGNNGNGISTSGGGLSTGAKIGIGVGVPLVVGLLVGIGIFLWCAGKRKGKKNANTPGLAQPEPQEQQQVYPPGPHGYIPGYPGAPIEQTPPPMYLVPQVQPQSPYGGYPKETVPEAVEMEQEYHFARPGVVEMDAGTPVGAQQQIGWLRRRR